MQAGCTGATTSTFHDSGYRTHANFALPYPMSAYPLESDIVRTSRNIRL